MKPLPLVDGCLFVDNSMLESLTTCTRALEYNKLYSRVLAADKPSLNFGSAIHEALEWRYATIGTAIPTVVDEETQAAVLADFFAKSPTPEGDYRTLNWAIEVIKRYNAKYQIEPFNLLQYKTPIPCPKCNGEGGYWEDASMQAFACCHYCNGSGERKVMVELPFSLPLFTYTSPGLTVPVVYIGRIDLPTLEDGAIWVTDHKTTSLLGAPFWERLRLSAQLRGYCWAFRQITGERVAGYRVNALRVKEPPQSLASGKEGVIAKWWDESLGRERFYVTDEGIEEWKANTIALVEEFFYHYQKGFFPMKTAWCTQFGRCQYFDVCTLPPGERGAMLSSGLYTDNKWSPLNRPSKQVTK